MDSISIKLFKNTLPDDYFVFMPEVFNELLKSCLHSVFAILQQGLVK